jgi:ABC-type Fe3+/spermidine/putrescine transport system ATPase subunit
MMSGAGGSIGVHALTVAYGQQNVLHGVDLGFAAGSFTALLGSSGCGKTTLLRTISGFVPARSGRIDVDGRDITALPPEARGMAMVFQSYALWPHMTVAQNMGYGLKLRKASKAAIAAKIDSLLAMLGLEGLADRKVTDLSGGQRQRVALGRALAIEPSILLLDEPLSNLDAKIRLTMRHEIRAIQQRLGLTVIHVTHDREEAMTMADRLVVMERGRIAQIGTPEDVYDRPNSPFLARFMGAENRLDFQDKGAGLERAGYRLPARLNEGDGKAIVYFRDDAARFTASETEAGIKGHIVARSYPGGFYRYAVATDDAVIAVSDETAREPGSTVTITLDPRKIHIFPAKMAADEEGRT